MIRRMGHASILAALVLVDVAGCKPSSTSSTKAIVSADGTKATALVYMRRSVRPFRPTGNTAADHDTVTQASRLSLGLVRCTGSNAAASLTAVEAQVLPTSADDALMRMDSLTFDGTALYSRDGTHIYPNCAVSAHVGGALGMLIGNDPITQGDFDSLQLVYLGARGPFLGKNVLGFRTAMYQLLAETIGAIPPPDLTMQNDRITKLDAMFNPCVAATDPGMNARHFTKFNLFANSCDGAGNYVVKGSSFDAAFNTLSATVGRGNLAYLAAVRKLNPATSAALQLSTDSYSSMQSYAAGVQGRGASADGPNGAPSALGATPAIQALSPRQRDALKRMFGVVIGQGPGQVMSHYAFVAVPPATQGVGLTDTRGLALDGTAAASPAWSGWTKMPNGQFTGTTTDPTGKQQTYVARGQTDGSWIVEGYQYNAKTQQNVHSPSLDYSGYYDATAKGYYLQNINTQEESFQSQGKTEDGSTYIQNYKVADQKDGTTAYTPQGQAWFTDPKTGITTFGNGHYAAGTMNTDGSIKWKSDEFTAAGDQTAVKPTSPDDGTDKLPANGGGTASSAWCKSGGGTITGGTCLCDNSEDMTITSGQTCPGASAPEVTSDWCPTGGGKMTAGECLCANSESMTISKGETCPGGSATADNSWCASGGGSIVNGFQCKCNSGVNENDGSATIASGEKCVATFQPNHAEQSWCTRGGGAWGPDGSTCVCNSGGHNNIDGSTSITNGQTCSAGSSDAGAPQQNANCTSLGGTVGSDGTCRCSDGRELDKLQGKSCDQAASAGTPDFSWCTGATNPGQMSDDDVTCQCNDGTHFTKDEGKACPAASGATSAPKDDTWCTGQPGTISTTDPTSCQCSSDGSAIQKGGTCPPPA